MALSRSTTRFPERPFRSRTIGFCSLILAYVLIPTVFETGHPVCRAEEKAQKTVSSPKPPLDRLIEQLGAPEWSVRQMAQEKLARRGAEAYDALLLASESTDLEIASRAKYLLLLISFDPTRPGDPPKVRECLVRFWSQNPPEQYQRLDRLARLKDAGGLEALCRLIRFDQTNWLAETAVARILKTVPDDRPFSKKEAEIIQKQLGQTRGRAADWLRGYVRFGENPTEAMADWNRLLRAEVDRQKKAATPLPQKIFQSLLEKQIGWTLRLGANPTHVKDTLEIVSLASRGKISPSQVDSLTDWITTRQSWKTFPGDLKRFCFYWDLNPQFCLYQVAQIHREKGESNAAEEAAQKGFEIESDQIGSTQASLRLGIADRLATCGLFDWARREYLHVAETSGKNQAEKNQPGILETRMAARVALAEMLHDQGQNLEAAEALTELLEKKSADLPGLKVQSGSVDGIDYQARKEYFYACHYAQQNDPLKQKESLRKAYAIDPNDVDVLIGLFQTTKASKEAHEKIRLQIRHVLDEMRALRKKPSHYHSVFLLNQMAWLIGNTEGDFSEAVRLSRQSLQIRPKTAGYLDTLAQAYFAKGDLENAVKTQIQAVELSPYSKQITEKLALFRRAYEKRFGRPAPKPSLKPERLFDSRASKKRLPFKPKIE